MPGDTVFGSEGSHPAPHRRRVRVATLAFGLVAAPTVWTGQLLINATLPGYACYPSSEPRTTPLPGWSWLLPLLLTVDVITFIVCIAAAIVAFRSWRITRNERTGASRYLIEVGEGRTRFLAMWGMLISAGFACATVFNFVALFLVPPCGP